MRRVMTIDPRTNQLAGCCGGRRLGLTADETQQKVEQIQAWADVLKDVARLFGGNTRNRIAKEYAANRFAYQRARTGDTYALRFLRQRTGKYGILSVTDARPIWLHLWPTDPGDIGWGGGLGGWATKEPKANAEQLYAAALGVLQGAPDPAPVDPWNPDPDPGAGTPPLDIPPGTIPPATGAGAGALPAWVLPAVAGGGLLIVLLAATSGGKGRR